MNKGYLARRCTATATVACRHADTAVQPKRGVSGVCQLAGSISFISMQAYPRTGKEAIVARASNRAHVCTWPARRRDYTVRRPNVSSSAINQRRLSPISCKGAKPASARWQKLREGFRLVGALVAKHCCASERRTSRGSQQSLTTVCKDFLGAGSLNGPDCPL